jgi:ubiquinone/menaquinone biosynthesis C-methylase UbiE
MTTIKDFIVDEKLKKIESNKIYTFLEESKSAKFYDELFSETHKKDDKPELYDQTKQLAKEKNNAYGIIEKVVLFLEQELHKDAIVIEIGGGVYQARSANACNRFNNYFPLDISYSSIKRYCEKFNKVGFVGDAKELPFKDNSIDCIFTHTFLEHPLEPEKVLSEISRVLKVGGIVIHNDAWFCRWWHRYGLIGLKKYQNMIKKEKMIHIAAKISELKVLRVPPIILKRLYKEIFQSKKAPLNLTYKKLTPNYQLHLGCDEDAASSIDPIDVVRFYESRNFVLVNQLSFIQRLFYPNKYIVLKKIVADATTVF